MVISGENNSKSFGRIEEVTCGSQPTTRSIVLRNYNFKVIKVYITIQQCEASEKIAVIVSHF